MRTAEERRFVAKRFNPNQPRWPKANGDKGGQWRKKDWVPGDSKSDDRDPYIGGAQGKDKPGKVRLRGAKPRGDGDYTDKARGIGGQGGRMAPVVQPAYSIPADDFKVKNQRPGIGLPSEAFRYGDTFDNQDSNGTVRRYKIVEVTRNGRLVEVTTGSYGFADGKKAFRPRQKRKVPMTIEALAVAYSKRVVEKRYSARQPRWPKGSGDKSGISKHGRKGEPGYYFLHPGRKQSPKGISSIAEMIQGAADQPRARNRGSIRAERLARIAEQNKKENKGTWKGVIDAAQRALAEAEEMLNQGRVSDKKYHDSGMSLVHSYTMDNGKKVIVKDLGPNSEAEVAGELIGHALAKAMGLRSPAIRRLEPETRRVGSPGSVTRPAREITSNRLMIEYIDGPTGYDGAVDRLTYTRLIESKEGKLIGLLDTIIQNRDRHDGNWLIENGKPVPIDHGLPDGHMNSEGYHDGAWHWVAPVSPFANRAKLYSSEYGLIVKWLDNDYTKRDIQKLRAVVESMESEFRKFDPSARDEALARVQHDARVSEGLDEGEATPYEYTTVSRSYEAALDRLEQLELHAKGTVDLLP